jgi:hypothetical protein
MRFNTTQDAINYLKENSLFNIPVSLELHITQKPKIMVWFGTMEFGRFSKLDDYFEMCVIESIDEKVMLEDDDNIIDDYMTSNGYSGYMIPSQYNGEVVYSNQYVEENCK